MEPIHNFIGTRINLFVIFLILLLFGIFISITGIKIRKYSKLASIITVTLGIIFSLATLYAMIYTLFFGFNS